jgi:hypothetical protein
LDGTVKGDSGILTKIDGGFLEDLHVRTNQLRVWIFEDERVRRKKRETFYSDSATEPFTGPISLYN